MGGVSFASRGLYGGVEWIFTFKNYAQLVDPLYWGIYGRSFILAFFTTVVCLVLGFPLAYVMARSSVRMQSLLILLVLIPFWTNFLVRTYAWMVILRNEGVLKTVLVALGLQDVSLEILYTNWAVLIGLVYGYLPFMVVPLYLAIERIPLSLEEAARDLNAQPWSVFWRVVVPLARPGIVAGCLLVFIPSIGAFITPHLLGGGQSMMIGTLVQHEFLVVRDWPFGSAISFVLMFVILLASVPLFRRQGWWNSG
ncbi:MAG: ABC transporter permease [Nitrospirota bacterium]|nr:ABC transporter permease [Nitrospirota bacterium]